MAADDHVPKFVKSSAGMVSIVLDQLIPVVREEDI